MIDISSFRQCFSGSNNNSIIEKAADTFWTIIYEDQSDIF